MKKYFKKSLSLFMAALMLMSCWVFFAPTKAEAASAGNYTLTVSINVGNKTDNSNSGHSTMQVYYKPNNGTGNETSKTYDIYSTYFTSEGDKTVTLSVPGFPTKIYSSLKSPTWDVVKYTKKEVKINGVSAWTGSNELSSNGGFSPGTKTDTITLSAASPKASSISFNISNGTSINVGTWDGANVTKSITATVKDQYGVNWYQSPASWSIGTTSAATQGYTGASLSNTGVSDSTTLTVTPNAQTANKSTSSYQKTLYVKATRDGASGVLSFNLINPSYTWTYYSNNPNTNAPVIIKRNGTTDWSNSATTGSYTESKRYYYLPSIYPTDATREGYVFKGFYSTKNAISYEKNEEDFKPSGIKFSATNTVKDGKDNPPLTYYAAWWARNVKVTLVDNGGNIIKSYVGKYDKDVAYAAGLANDTIPTKDVPFDRQGTTGTFDYVFDHWEVLDAKDINGNDIQGAYGTSIDDYVLKGDTVFVARYTLKKNSYTVNFLDENGATLKTDSYSYRDEPIQPVTSKESDNYFDYTFKGWHKVADGEQKKGYVVNADGYLSTSATSDAADEGNKYIGYTDDLTVRSDATYVPVFEKKFIEYKVNFVYRNATGTEITTEVKSYHYNDDLECPEVPDSYTLDGSRYPYLADQWKKNGTVVGNMPTKATESATYVASYGDGIAAVYDITFKFFGTDAVEKTETQKVAHGSSVTVPEYPEIYRDESNEYTFDKWIDQDGHNFDATGHKDAVYTAQYKASPLYTATFMNEGEQYGDVFKYTEGETIAAPAGTPEKAADKTASEYTFVGWFDEDGNKLGKMGAADAVYYAKYEPTYINYTVNFVWKDENGNDVTDTKTYHYRDKITVPADPADYQDNTYKYTFKAWSPDVSSLCTDDVTYTATYRKEYVYYTVTWMQEAGTVDGKTNYSVLSTDAHLYNEKVRITTYKPDPNVLHPDDNHTNVLVGWEYEENGVRKPLERGYRITKNMVFYPVYESTARVCKVNLYDEDGTTLIQVVEVPYNTDLSSVATYSEPKKAYTDAKHFNFDKWLTLDGSEASTVITGDINLKASYIEEDHDYAASTIVDKLPTFTETGTGTAVCECGKEVATTIDKIPDTKVPTAKLFIKDSITESGVPFETKKVLVAPSNNIIIATDDKAEASTYNPDGKGIGVKTIEYLVSIDNPIDNIAEAEGWNVRFDYDAYVEALKAENGDGKLTAEQELMLKEFESNATAYVGDLETVYPALVDGATFYFYAKITDRNGNTNYVGSNKLVYDKTAPTLEVTGSGNGGSKFCVAADVKAEDDVNLVSFTVNGEEKEITDGKASVSLDKAGTYQIVATDEAGNKTTRNITIVGEHREKIYTTAATCETDGSVVKRCTLCGEQIGEATTIEKHGHNFVEVGKVEATCVEGGYTLERCTYCGKTQQTNPVPATGGHKYGDWITDKEATCKTDGTKHRVCSVCQDVEIGVVESTGTEHKWYRDVVTKPTCTEDGYSEHTCKYCGTTERVAGSETEKLGHEASGVWVITKEATCTEPGERVQWCVRCGDACGEPLKKETIPAAGHAWAYSKTVAPTETEKGYTLYVCMICGETMKANETPVLVPHTVTFLDADKTEYKKFEKKYKGDVITSALVPEPTKEADETYRYTFSGWVDENGKSVTLPVAVADEDITLTATYESRYINYTVVFYNEAGNKQFKKVGYLHYGQKLTTDGPSDYEDAMYNYTFAGWVKKDEPTYLEDILGENGEVIKKANVSKTITVTDADTQEYKAVFSKTLKKYNVVFAYSYTDVITNFKVDAGTTASFPSDLATPVKKADETYHYKFSGWKGDSLENITKDTLAIADFTGELHTRGTANVIREATCTETGITEYKCTDCDYVERVVTPAKNHSWSTTPDEDGNLICTICGEKKDSGIRYSVSFYTESESGLSLVKTIGYLKKGAVLSDSQIPTPTKAATATKTYVFKGWYKKGDDSKTAVEITKTITENAEYVAIFEETERTFKVIYAIDSDNVLQVINDVKGGSPLPAYTGDTPTSDKFDDYGHDKFYGWSKENSDFPNGITEDVYITAVFISEDHTCVSSGMHGATCTKPMEETFKCTKCGYTYTKTSGKAKGHSYTLVETVDPTSTKEGYELYKCSVCGDEYKKILAPKSYIYFTVIVKDQDGDPVQGAKVTIFDGTKFIASGSTDSEGKVIFRVEEAKKYRVVVEYEKQHIEGDITVNPDGSTSGDDFNVQVTRCSCTCHRDGVWPAIFRFFHKIIKMLVGHFVCCGEPDARYGS